VLSVTVDRDEAIKVENPNVGPEFIQTALENKKRLNGLLDQLLAIEKRRKLQANSEPVTARKVSAWTNTDMELLLPMFEQHRAAREIVMVD
jgi:hypothetical protein